MKRYVKAKKQKSSEFSELFFCCLMKESLLEFLDLGFLTTQTTEVVNA